MRTGVLRGVSLGLLVILGLAAFAGPASASPLPPALVRVIDTAQWSPPSPDPMGIAYDPSSGRLIMSDSEVEEMSIWQGSNVFESSPTGNLLRTGNTTGFSTEPTGVAVNPANNHVFFSDDNARRVTEVARGSDGLLLTSDDTRTFLSTPTFGSSDPEGVGFGAGSLFIIDGAGHRVYRVQPGPNGIFNGVPPGGDDQVTSFSTDPFNMTEPEGIDYASDSGTLFICDRQSRVVVETTLSGSLVRSMDLAFTGIRKPAGLAYGPTSNDPSRRSVYLADRGVDNDSNPSENDGRIYEVSVATAAAPPSNSPPVVTNPGAQSDVEGGVVSVQIQASDANGDTLSYGASGLPAGLSINSSTGVISGTVAAGAAANSPYSSQVSASDGQESDVENFTWTITATPPPNNPPVVTNPGPRSNVEGQAVSLPVVATDADGDTLSYSASGLPAGLSINPSTGVISGTVAAGAAANSPYSSQVSASDGQAGDVENFTWTITEATGGGGSVTVPVTAVSDDAEEAPSGVVDLTSSDLELADEGTSHQTVGIRFAGVAVPGGATIVGAYIQFQVDEVSPNPASLTIQGQAADDALTFQAVSGNVSTRPRTTASVPWAPVPWNTVGQAGVDQRTPNLSAVVQQVVSRSGWAGGHAMAFIITGSGRRTAEAFNNGTLSLHIDFQTGTPPSNNPPVVTNPGAQSDVEGQAVSLPVQASDADGDTLTYGASGLPPGLSINPSTGVISGTVSAGAAANSPYSSQVSASDGTDGDTEPFTWTITVPNSPPVVTNPGTQSNVEGDAVSVQIQASDADGGTLTYSATGLPAGLSINPSTGLISGTVPLGAAANSPYSSHVSATDGTDSDTESFSWTISPASSVRFVGVASARGRVSTLTIARPGGVVAGDLLLASIAARGAPTVTAPTGWTVVQANVTGGNLLRQVVFSHVAGANEQSYAFTLGSRTGVVGLIVAYRGVDVVESPAGQANAASTAIAAPSTTASTAGSVEVGFFGIAVGATISPPSGMSERGEIARSSGSGSLRVALEASDALVGSGSIAACTALASVSAVNIGQVIVLRPLP